MINSTMVSGEDFSVDFIVTVNDEPIDISDYTAKIDLRRASTEIEIFEDDSPEITREDISGMVTLKIPAAKTREYSFPDASMDLLLTKSDGGIRSDTIKITLHRGITR